MSKREAQPALGFLAWTPAPGRAQEIAAALGGVAFCSYPAAFRRRRFLALRYAVSTFTTVLFLARRRPRAVIVTNPPIWPAILTYVYARLTNRPMMLDSHPSAFGAKASRMGRLTRPLHAWLSRRCIGTLVTTSSWVDVVDAWGGHGVVAHEPPTSWPTRASTEARTDDLGRPRVLFICVFGPDEPVDAVLEAARLLPDVQFDITGDVARGDAELPAAAPANVRWLGYLEADAYRHALVSADLVLALTTEPTSVLRAAYEAVYAHRPLVVSDWPVLRDLFPYAVHVPNTTLGIAAGISAGVRQLGDLAAVTPEASALQHRRWNSQLSVINTRLATATHPANASIRQQELIS